MGQALIDIDRPQRVWLPLVLIFLLMLPPLLVRLGARDVTHTMERVALITSQETWFRQMGRGGVEPEPYAWMMPSLNGQDRVRKPPLLVWMNMLAWTGLNPDEASVDDLVYRARLLAVGMGLVTVAATYWAGYTLGGLGLAIGSALILGTTLFLQRQARTASYDIHMVAWVAVSIAAGLWAMRPFATPPSARRRIIGWTISAVALAAAVMVKGPLAFVVTLVPLAIVVWLAGADTRLNAASLILMALAAVLLATPWHWYAWTRVPDAVRTWTVEYEAERDEWKPPWYYLGLLGLALPWTLWLVAGLLFPFLRTDGPPRRQMLTPWLWFVAIFVIFSIPGTKSQRYILPLLPALALVAAQLWEYHQRLADRGETDPGVNLLRIPHWAGVVLASLAIGPLLAGQEWLVDEGYLERAPLGLVDDRIAIAASLALVPIAVLGARWHFDWKPRRALIACAVWACVLWSFVWYAYAEHETAHHPIRRTVVTVEEQVGRSPLSYLVPADSKTRVEMELLLYLRRNVPAQTLEEVRAMAEQTSARPRFLLAPIDADEDALRDMGWRPLEETPGALSVPSRLWRLDGPVTP